MSGIRYSAASIATTDPQTQLVGGSAAVTNEDDLTTYLDYHNSLSSGGSFDVEFGAVPDIHTVDRVELHIVAYGESGFGTDGTTFLFFGGLQDQAGHTLPGSAIQFTSKLDGTPQHHCSIQMVKEFDTSTVDENHIRLRVISHGATTLKIYGIWISTVNGLNLEARRSDISPYVAIGMNDYGVIALDVDANALLITSGQTNQSEVVPFTNGMLAVGGYTAALYVLGADGASTYSSMDYDDVAIRNELGGEFNMLPLRESNTVLVSWYGDSNDDRDVAVHSQYNLQGQLVGRVTVTDGWMPTTGGEYQGRLVYLAGGLNARDRSLAGSVFAGDGVHVLDLATGTDRQLIAPAALVATGTASGEGAISTLCVDPRDGTLFIAGNDADHDPESCFWISRWSSSGAYLGRLSFWALDRNGAEYWTLSRNQGAGSLTIPDDGRLIFFFSGSLPGYAGYSDAVMQMEPALVPSDGSSVRVSLGAEPSAGNACLFYAIPDGLQQGSGAQCVNPPLHAVLTSGFGGSRVKFREAH